MASVVKKRGRSYDQCVYKNCTSHRIDTKSRLFRFPVATDWRFDYWLQYTGNPRLKNWKPSSLRNAGLCALHFNPDDISITGSLRRDAFPLPYYKDEGVIADGNNPDPVNLPKDNKVSSTSETPTPKVAATPIDITEWEEESSSEEIEPTRTSKKPEDPPAIQNRNIDSNKAISPKAIEPTRTSKKPDDGSAIQNRNIDSNKANSPKAIEPVRTSKKPDDPPAIQNRNIDSNKDVSPKVIERIPTFEEIINPDVDYLEDEETLTSLEEDSSETQTCVNSVYVTPRRLIPAVINYDNISAAELGRQNRYLRRNIARLTATVSECRKLNNELSAKLKRASNQNDVLRTKCKKKTVEQILDERNCKEPAARAMVKLQLHKKNLPFDSDEKNLAMQLFCHSAPAYKRLLKAGCNLPDISAVRKWISETGTNSRTRIVFDSTQESNCDNEDHANLFEWPSEMEQC